MATAVLYTKSGAKSTKTVQLPASVFGEAKVNQPLLAQAVRAYQASHRQVSARTLTRGKVRGGGKKPWRQKGTGRARAGSIRSPLWRGGGTIFGPTGQENYTVGMNQKARRAALRQALSAKDTVEAIKIIESFTCPEGKVKPTLELLKKLEAKGKVLIVVSSKDALIDRATRNLPAVRAIQVDFLNVYDVLGADTLIMAADVLEKLTQWLGIKARPTAKSAEAVTKTAKQIKPVRAVPRSKP
ncbi:50S ribosomal protein L4 [Candidatus Microgenomates bacterium]|nr:50S ribosomal protein L4 [Candidatus Microgenomates bacterium]